MANIKQVFVRYMLIVCSQLYFTSAQDPCSSIEAERRDHVLEFNSTCYHLVQQRLTWEQARNECKARDMVLAVIPNEDTNRKLYQHGADLDFNDIGTSTSYWIGGRIENSQTRQIVWEEDPGTSFADLDRISPDRSGCITMELSLTGSWYVNVCDQPPVFSGYICAKPGAIENNSLNGSGSLEPRVFVIGVEVLLMYVFHRMWNQS